MPNIFDLVEITKSLETHAVHVFQERCVAVRHRQSKCTKCIDACLANAITVAKNKVQLDHDLCVGCGACTAVCPVEALIPIDPFDEMLSDEIKRCVANTQGTAIFACARIASKHLGDPEKYAKVACLARMEESLLVELASQGTDHIIFVDGECETCKYRSTTPLINVTVESANKLLAAQGSSVQVVRASEFPQEVSLSDGTNALGDSRRAFFSGARSRAKDAVTTTAEVMVLKKHREKEVSLRDKLKVNKAGTLPQFSPKRRERVLDSMYNLGKPVAKRVDTRLFGSIYIDTKVCNGCGMCAVFCISGAIVKANPRRYKIDGLLLEFSAADCVQCRLCEDICAKSCLWIESTVSLEELFDFEPRSIQLPRVPFRKSVLSGTRR